MVRKALVVGGVLIAIYLGVANATGGGVLITDAGNATAKVVKTFQGRG